MDVAEVPAVEELVLLLEYRVPVEGLVVAEVVALLVVPDGRLSKTEISKNSSGSNL